MGKMWDLHATSMGSIPSTLYGLPSPARGDL